MLNLVKKGGKKKGFNLNMRCIIKKNKKNKKEKIKKKKIKMI